MTYGNEPRRRGRPSDSSRRGSDADEADDWLAGYRPAPDERRREAPDELPRGRRGEPADGYRGREPDDYRRGPSDDFPRGRRNDYDETTARHGLPAAEPEWSTRSGGPEWEDHFRRGESPRSESPRSYQQPRRASGADPSYPAAGPPSGYPAGPTSGPPVSSTGSLPAVDRRRVPPPGPGAVPPPVPGPVSPPYPPPQLPPPPLPPRGSRAAPTGTYGRRRPDSDYDGRAPVRAEPVLPRVDPTGPWTDPGSRRARPADRRGPDLPEPGHQRRSRVWLVALASIGVLALIAACGLGTFLMVKDERNGPSNAHASNQASAQKRDISSRDVDPAPLTEAEVFPNPTIVAAPNEPPYQVLKTQASADCRGAATDDLGNLLVQSGCSQVVRATLKSPNGAYLITSGIFNLKNEASANQAHESIKPIVDSQKGRFTGLLAGQGTEAIVRAPAHLGWNVKGHFLAYCVIARADGRPFASGDGFPQQIIFDLVETHLRDGVIGARAVVSPANPAGSSSGGAKIAPSGKAS